MKFIKIVWILSVFVILIFYVVFESFRIYDFFTGNYTIETMQVSDYNYSSNSRRKSITIIGHIKNQRVYFSRFDNEIEELYNLYPGIASDKLSSEDKKIISSVFPDSNLESSKTIKVLKFKHSQIVMLTKDNEFQSWKTNLYFFTFYCIMSIILFIIIRKLKRKKVNTKNCK